MDSRWHRNGLVLASLDHAGMGREIFFSKSKDGGWEMRKHLLTGFALFSLLMLGASAFAQGPRDADRENERYYRGRLFERTRMDLDRVGDKAIPFTGDRSRVRRAKDSLNDLQRQFDEGRVDDR